MKTKDASYIWQHAIVFGGVEWHAYLKAIFKSNTTSKWVCSNLSFSVGELRTPTQGIQHISIFHLLFQLAF